ncbi:WD40 repeat-like protein [Serendipita vermifera]|nr:WD40 repeat-like protein [Serendipita vermifera]
MLSSTQPTCKHSNIRSVGRGYPCLRLKDCIHMTYLAITAILKGSNNRRHYIKLAVCEKTKACSKEYGVDDFRLRWDIQPSLYAFVPDQKPYIEYFSISVLRRGESLTVKICGRRLPCGPTNPVTQFSLEFSDMMRSIETLSEDPIEIHNENDIANIGVEICQNKGSHRALEVGIGILQEHEKLITLNHLEMSGNALRRLLAVPVAFAGLVPHATPILEKVEKIHRSLENKKSCNQSILKLAKDMAQALEYITDVGQFARLTQLEAALRDAERLIEDTTNFIVEYSSRSSIANSMRFNLTSAEWSQIEELTTRFSQFKQRFDRGLATQSLVNLETLLKALDTSQDDSLLSKLKPKHVEVPPLHRGCLRGTREDIFEAFDKWALDFEAPNILRLCGDPGTGKSTIARSLEDRLVESGRLGSYFVFQRDNASLLTPTRLWSTVGFDLTQEYPTVRKSVVGALKLHNIRPNRANEDGVDGLFFHAIHIPLLSSQDIPKGRLPIVIVDAIDECGGLESHMRHHRQDLLRTLKAWSNLPKEFKLVVTSRSETEIEQAFEDIPFHSIELDSGENVGPQSSDDIHSFLKQEFQRIARRYPNSLEPDWPKSEALAELTNRAAGLFIWAETLVRFIEGGVPKKRLDLIMNRGSINDMATFYKRILDISFPIQDGEMTREFRSIVGAVIVAKTPLSPHSLQQLLSMEANTVEDICNRLSSVLEFHDFKEPLRIRHQTFVDFLIDKDQCPSAFLIEPMQEHYNLAVVSLRLMRNGLRFNILGLESSYVRNTDIVELDLRIKENVPLNLSYACFWWTGHLSEVKCDVDDKILASIHYFISNQFLFWLEVISLLKQSDMLSRILSDFVDWMKEYDHDEYAMAREMLNFVATFNGVISQSVPHIYLSALSFTPRESLIAKKYASLFPHVLCVDHKSGGLRDWPVVQKVLIGHERTVHCIAVSHDSKRIASGGKDKTVRIWDMDTGEMIAGPFEGHGALISFISFSPDGSRILSASHDTTIRIWNSWTCEAVIGPLRGHTKAINAASLSRDGTMIASASEDKTIRLWCANTGQASDKSFEHKLPVKCIHISNNKELIGSGTEYDIRIWSIRESILIHAIHLPKHSGVNSIMFSPDDRWVISGGDRNLISTWDVETGKRIGEPLRGHSDSITCVRFFSNGSRVVSGSKDHNLRVWDIKENAFGKACYTLRWHTFTVKCITISPRDDYILSGSEDGTICVWDISRIKKKSRDDFRGHNKAISSVSFSPNGLYIASGSQDGKVYVWNMTDGSIYRGPFPKQTDEVTSVNFSADGSKLISGSNKGDIRIWDIKSCKAILGPFKAHSGFIRSVVFSPTGNYIVSGSDDGTIRKWDSKTGRGLDGDFEGHDDKVRCVAFSNDGSRLVSCSNDKSIRVWDATTGQLAQGPLIGHTENVTTVAFSHDGQTIASGSHDHSVRIWNAWTGQSLVNPCTGHTDTISSVTFSSDDRYTISGSRDATIRVWTTVTGNSHESSERPY